MTLADVCTDCHGPLSGRIVHLQGQPWHHACRVGDIALRAELRAVRLTSPRLLHIGRALAAIQRPKPTEPTEPATLQEASA